MISEGLLEKRNGRILVDLGQKMILGYTYK